MANSGQHVTVPRISSPWSIGNVSAPWDLVSNRFDQSLDKAEEMYDLLLGYLHDMESAIDDAPVVEIDQPDVDTSYGLQTSGLSVPAFDEGDIQAITPESYDVVIVESGGTLPTFNSADLSSYPDETHTVALVETDQVIPSFNRDDLTAVVDETYTIVPVSSGQTLPTFDRDDLVVIPSDTYALPTITTLPTIDTDDLDAIALPDQVDPTVTWTPDTVPTTVYNAIIARMLTDLQSGSTGLDATVEQAIYDRALTRQQLARDTAYQKLNDDAAGRAFAFPSAALLSALTDFAAEGLRMETDYNNNIVTTQADLAQKNSQFMFQQAVALEQLIRQTTLETDRNKLDLAKTRVQMLIQDYSERVKAYLAIWEGRKIKVQAQSEALRGVIDGNKGEIEIYRAQYDALKTRIDAAVAANKNFVDVYLGEIQGYSEAERAVAAQNNTEVEIFKAKYDAFKTRVEAVVSKNRELIDLYIGDIQGYSEVEKAAASQNSSAVDVFKAQYDAFKTKVDAVSAQNKNLIDVYLGEIQGYAEGERAVAAVNSSSVEVFKARYDAFKTRVDAVVATNKGLIDVYNGQVQGYAEAERAVASRNSSAIELIKARVDAAELNLRAMVAEVDGELKGYVAESDLRKTLSTDMTRIAAQVVASMMSAVNASASLGYSGNSSESKSVSNTASLSESHSYEHDPS